MNNFAIIELLDEFLFDRVTYYSVKLENKEVNEFEDFILKHQDNKNLENEFDDILSWLEVMGEEHGAKQHLFRNEMKADALPPSAQYLKIIYHENLRLYCMRISTQIVILFNGGVKSKKARTAQDCPSVKPHFVLANILAGKIEKLITDKELTYSNDFKKLIIPSDLEIIY